MMCLQQAHADAATLLMKNVFTPLTEISTYKKSQSKRLHSFRENFDNIITGGNEAVFKVWYLILFQTHLPT